MAIIHNIMQKCSNIVSTPYTISGSPHMCGEYAPLNAIPLPSTGSPPHVWGKLLCHGGGEVGVRITPTCVGKANDEKTLDQGRKDHPHMCGESRKMHILKKSNIGLPPHVWGKLTAADIDLKGKRITPTCVGKAWNFLSSNCNL